MKKWPSRYKFGIIAVGIMAVILLILFVINFFTVHDYPDFGNFSVAGFVFLILSLPGILLTAPFPFLGYLGVIICDFIFYFLIGYFLGLLDDFLKNRNKTTQM